MTDNGDGTGGGNTNLFIMKTGSKPGDTPTVGTNVYYDTPTTPMIVCTDTLSTASVACFEIRNDNTLPQNGLPVATGILANGAKTTSDNIINVDGSISVTGTTYAAVNSNPDTITDSSNGLVSAGFTTGMEIIVSGSSESGNNTSHTIASVVAGTLTLTASSSLTADSAGDTWTITRKIDPRQKFSIGHQVYKSDGTLLGTISSMTNSSITFSDDLLSAVSDNDQLYTSIGVSNSHTYNILNRQFPNTAATSALYLDNLANTKGYRIKNAIFAADGSTVIDGATLSGIDITVNDYFVIIFADDHLKHHVAKITSVDTDDYAGDAFTFSPSYGSEISKGTKFAVYKGPLVTETSVMAVGYGLYGNATTYAADSDETDGTGIATESRHAGFTYINKPLFYFYNDRLDKENQLNHNTKYMLHYSRSHNGTEKHYKRCFLTHQYYGNQIVDYGSFTVPATLTDKNRDFDALDLGSADTEIRVNGTVSSGASATITVNGADPRLYFNVDDTVSVPTHGTVGVINSMTATTIVFDSAVAVTVGDNVFLKTYSNHAKATDHYSEAVQNEYAVCVSDWDKCFTNYKRNSVNLIKAQSQPQRYPEGNLTGPTRYAHYDASPDKNNFIPDVMELDIFDSISESGSYIDMKIGDIKRIYNKKVNQFDKIRVRKEISSGEIFSTFDSALSGTVTGSTSSTTLTFGSLVPKYDLRLLLKSGSKYENIRIGNYYYSISAIAAPALVGSDYQQAVTINGYRLNTSAGFTGSISGAAEVITEQIAYRRTWSDITKTLIVSWPIDTDVTYTNIGASNQTATLFFNGIEITSAKSRLYNSYIFLTNGKESGHSFLVDYGDKNNNYVKLQTPRLQLYQDESDNGPNFLDYYSGNYILMKTVFVGSVESFEGYVEKSILKYHLSGRGNISKLKGPIVNKDFKFSDDIVYSTLGPIMDIEDSGVYGDVYTSTGVAVNHPSAGTYATSVDTIAVDATDPRTKFFIGDKVYLVDKVLIGTISSMTATSIVFDSNILVEVPNNQALYEGKSNAGSVSVAVSGTSFNPGDFIFKSDGTFIGRVKANWNGSSPLTFEEGILTRLFTGDDLYKQKTSNNISFSKAISANPSTNTVTSLSGTAEKGLFFTAGNIITDPANGETDEGFPTLEGSNLIGTSANSHSDAIGYYIHQPIGIDKDLSFAAKLADETTSTLSKKELHTPCSITNFNVVSIDSGDGETVIELAPNCPAILARVDENPEDIRFLTTDNSKLISTNIVSVGSNSTLRNRIEVTQNPFTQTGTDSAVTSIGSHLYLSDGTYIGKLLEAFTEGSQHYLTLDYIRNDVGESITLYRVDSNYSGLYMLNTQGLSSGGFLQMLNPTLSAIGKPVQMSSNILDDATYTVIDNDVINRFGQMSWRYFDLQKGKPGSISYREYRLTSPGSGYFKYKDYYCENDGNLPAYALAYQHKSGISTSVVSTIDYSRQTTSNSHTTLLPPNRGILPTTLSNVKDSEHIFSSEGWSLYPKHLDASVYGNYGASEEIQEGKVYNRIQYIKDLWQLIDPKTIRYFIFGPSDIYPESTTRQHHIGYRERDLTDYNLMLKNNEVFDKTDILHGNYVGSLNREKTTDDSYETIQISEASIKSNQIKRFGLMRLIECTFDWHFNMADPELPPSKTKLNTMENLYKYVETESSGHTISGNASATVLTLDATTSFKPLDKVYTSAGKFIGEIDSTAVTLGSISSSVITATSHGLDNDDKVIYSANTHGNRTTPLVPGLTYYVINKTTHTFQLSLTSGGGAITLVAGSGTEKFYRYDKITSTTLTLKANAYKLDDGYYTGLAYRQKDFKFTDATCDLTNGSTTVNCDASTQIYVGMAVTCSTSGFPSPAYVASITVGVEGNNVTRFELSANFTGTTANNQTLTFGNISRVGDWINGGTVKPEYKSHAIYGTDNKDTIIPRGITRTHMLKGAIFSGTSDWHTTNEKPQLANDFDYTGGIEGDAAGDGELSSTAAHAGRLSTYENIMLPLHGKVEIPASVLTSTRQSIMDSNYWDNDSKFLYTDLSVPSEVLQTIVDGSQTGGTNPTNRKLYSGMKALILDKFNFENRDFYSVAKGMTSHAIEGFIRRASSKSGGNQFSMLNLKVGELTASETSSLSGSAVNDSTYNKKTGSFANWIPNYIDSTDSDSNVSATTSESAGIIKGDGAYMVFKPVLYLDTNTAHAECTNVNLSSNSDSDIGSFMVTLTVNNDSSPNQFLRHCPNLSGCYLVSQAGKRWNFSSTTLASNPDVQDVSVSDRVPDKILYVISHTVTGSRAEQKHHLILDNTEDNNQFESDVSNPDYTYWRVMRPAETCIWPFQQDENIDLYRLTSKYTKMAYEDKTYGQIPSWSFQNNKAGTDQHVYNKFSETSSNSDWNEAALSMYVIIDPDAKGFDATDQTTQRNTSHLVLRQFGTLFGAGKTFDDNTYQMLLNDGNETFKSSVTVSTLSDYFCRLKLSNLDRIPKMNGIVSLGEIFTVRSKDKVNLSNVKTAHIGSTVTICDEAEKAAENIFKENSIEFSNEDLEFPYFSATNVQGLDASNAVNYLLNYKNKEVVIDKGDFEIVDKGSNFQESDIEIQESNTDIKVIEVSQEDSSFDFYNEVIVYGNKVKSTKRNSSSIKQIGKKTLEKFDESLTTQTETDKKARELLQLHTKSTKRYTLKLFEKGLEWIKAGDVIMINYPKEHLPYAKYKVLQVKHSTAGFIEIETGVFSKGLEDRLADLFIENKKTNAHLRGDKFKTPKKEEEYFSTLKIKPIKLIVKRTYAGGNQVIGFNTTFGFSTLFGFSTSGSSGSTTETVLEKELL